MTNTICDKTIEQPSSETVKQNILYTPGPVVSYRAFKHGKRSSRSIAETEYQRATESLQDGGFGRIVEFRVPRARSACKVFIKSKPEPYPTSAPLSSTEFDSLVAMPIHKDITQPMVDYLHRNDYL